MSPDATRRCRASPPPAGSPASGAHERPRRSTHRRIIHARSIHRRANALPRGIALSTATFLMSLAITAVPQTRKNPRRRIELHATALHCARPKRSTRPWRMGTTSIAGTSASTRLPSWPSTRTPDGRPRTRRRLVPIERRSSRRNGRATPNNGRARPSQRESSTTETLPGVVLRNIDVNTATEADIAGVISVGPEVAAQVLVERNKRRFSDWADLVTRVVGLGAAQPAAYASICGLTVDAEKPGRRATQRPNGGLHRAEVPAIPKEIADCCFRTDEVQFVRYVGHDCARPLRQSVGPHAIGCDALFSVLSEQT